MKSWKNLPAEILEMVFTLSNNNDQEYTNRKQHLFHCERVCRQWKLSAKRVAYSDITLKSEKATQKLIMTAREDKQQSFGELVRSIHFDFTPSPYFYAVYVPNLMTLFPLVEHLTGLSPTTQLYNVLDTKNEEWPRLKTISKPRDMESLQSYASFALKRHEQLTSLFIGDHVETSKPDFILRAENQAWNKLVQELPQFTNLKRLDFRKISASGLESFDDLIEQCPESLQSLGVVILPANARSVGSFTAENVAIHLSSIIQRPLVKSVSGNVVIHNDNTLKYMMHKYPKLDDMHINCQNPREFSDGVFLILRNGSNGCFFSSRVVADFISFASRIRSHSIQLQLPLNVLHEAIIGHEDLSTLSISYEREASTFYQLPPLDGYRMSTLQIRIGARSNTNEIGVVYNSRDGLSHIRPHLFLLQNCGACIYILTASTSSTGLHDAATLSFEATPSFEMDHVLQHCSNLRQLTISRSSLSLLELRSGISNASVTDLYLENVVLMSGDLLGVISRKLPSLKNMVIDTCKCYKDGALPMLELTNGAVDMSNTSFDSLYIKDTFVSGSFFFNTLYLKVCRKSDDGNATTTFHQFDYQSKTVTYKPTECSEEDFESKRESMNYVTYSVKCTTAKKIKIKVHCFDCELVL